MTLTFDEDNFDDMLCVNIFIEDDLINEGIEHVSVLLSTTDPRVSFSQSIGIVTIEDNDGKRFYIVVMHTCVCKDLTLI